MAGQDDGQDITAERFNGLMAAHQKALTELRELKGQGAGAQDGSGETGSPDSQQAAPQWDDGQQFEMVNGQLEPVYSPAPRTPNGPQNYEPRREPDVDWDYKPGSKGFPV
jgi:hypothetical protein